jgi:hypothetical protein
MKLIISVLATTWLMFGCASTPDEDASGAGHRDPRTGLCNDATPPPCEPPRG